MRNVLVSLVVIVAVGVSLNMKTKTINAVLTKKFNEFVSTITDETLRQDVKNG